MEAFKNSTVREARSGKNYISSQQLPNTGLAKNRAGSVEVLLNMLSLEDCKDYKIFSNKPIGKDGRPIIFGSIERMCGEVKDT